MTLGEDFDPMATGGQGSPIEITIMPLGLPGALRLPADAAGLIVFAHGSGSSRFSPRNAYVAEALGRAGYATLLFDLLTQAEEADRRNVFDIPLLAERVIAAIDWVAGQGALAALPIGLFGASTGAAAALVAATRLGGQIFAIVSRGGRPDLANADLADVRAPTLLLVGGQDLGVLELNRAALLQLHEPKHLAVVPGATHLFPEPGALDLVVRAAIAWFDRYLPAGNRRQSI